MVRENVSCVFISCKFNFGQIHINWLQNNWQRIRSKFRKERLSTIGLSLCLNRG